MVVFLMAIGFSALFAASSQGAAPPSPLPAPSPVEYRDEIERDFALRTIGQLQVTNMRGDIVIQGWSLDKIRIKARRRALASTPEEAKRLFSAVDFRYKSVDGFIELAAEYGRGLSLQDRLREREHPNTGMEMTVYAPANLKLRVWGVDGKITVKGWDAHVDVRASSGEIHIEGVKSGGVSVLCPMCDIRAKSIRGTVRCMGGAGAVVLSDVKGSPVYVEASSGAVVAERIQGEQLYVTKEGVVRGKELAGHIEFHTQGGAVEIVESSGFLSGRTTGGGITARMREWTFADKAVIESIQGNINLSLPADFSGDVDIFSGAGKAEIAFPVERIGGGRVNPLVSDPSSLRVGPVGRITGRVGDGGELLKVFSNRGNIQVIKGK